MLAPAERLTPSEWAERHRYLKSGTTEKPGRMELGYFPWQRPIIDVLVLEPTRRGVLICKPTQVGLSELLITHVGWGIDQRPGPMLYLTTTDTQARKFSLQRFEYMLDTAPVLADKVLRGREQHETILYKLFHGGSLSLFGSGSPSQMMSEPALRVYLDELDKLRIFPGYGSGWSLAQSRTRAFSRSEIWGWSTPTLPDVGISVLMRDLGDERRWFVACPHCGGEQWLKWGQVTIEGRDAGTARYVCEACGEVISDAQRWKAIYEGGFRSTLDPGVAAERRFAGFYINRLMSPRHTVRGIAELYLACRNEGDLQVFFNTELGEPYQSAATPVSREDLDRRAVREPQMPPPDDTMWLTVGVDAQAKNVFYTDVSAWTPDGLKHLLAYEVIRDDSGFSRLEGFLRKFAVVTGGRELRIALGCIDAQYDTANIYKFCQRVGASWLIPVWYGRVKHGDIWQWQLHKERNIHVLHLNRPYWMDRAHGRFTGGTEFAAGVVLPVGIADVYKEHVLANVRVEVEDRTFARRKVTWVKRTKQLHDDFLQAAVYAEVAHEMLLWSGRKAPGAVTTPPPPKVAPVHQEMAEEGGWINRVRKRQKRTGGWIRE